MIQSAGYTLLEQTDMLMVFIVLLPKDQSPFWQNFVFLPLSLFTQIVLLLNIITSILKDMAFGLYALHKIPVSPFLKAVEVSVWWLYLQHINCSTQFDHLHLLTVF